MCGIAGFIEREKDAPIVEREITLDKMCRIITHRGPDEQGMMVAGRAALGMRRLSIIDLKGGQQPISTEDGNLIIVFNGEIYNYRELKAELERFGHRFKTNSDTETILYAYKQFGAACLEKLRGMYAFAIWNKQEESLFIARDRVGKKPLFYTLTERGNLVFGSELKVLLAHGEMKKEIDFAALDAYLTFGYVPEEFCIFKRVNKLAPGHYLIFKDGKVETKEYWDFKYEKPSELKSETEYVERLRELITDAVKVRLISEVPLGAFLSGGVDSSAIVGTMARLSDKPVKTFSIGFNEDSFNELKFARLAAEHFKTEHHEFVVTPDLMETIDELVWHFDEPFADPSSLPTFMVSKMAREYVTVALSGDGGDELFAGYTRYVTDKKKSGLGKLPRSVRENFLKPLSERLPHGAKGKNYLYNSSLNQIDRYIDSISHFNSMHRKSLYSNEFFNNLNGDFGKSGNVFRQIAGTVSTGNPTDNLLYLDSKTYLVGDILTKVDRMSMAASLEARVPLLDHKLIEFVTNIPTELKLKGLETKYIFRKAVRGLVPDAILDRPKQGFGVPINEWINSQLKNRIRETLLEKRALERGYFDVKYIETLFEEHEKNRRDHSLRALDFVYARTLASKIFGLTVRFRFLLKQMATLDSYQEYAQQSIENFARREATDKYLLLNAVKDLSVKMVLDVGCGAGQELIPFIEKTGAFCIGIDAAAELGKVTKNFFGTFGFENRAAFTRCYGENLPFADAGFDVVLCRVALPYMNNRQTIAEVARILRPGGIFLLKTHAPAFYFGMIRQRWASFSVKQIAYPLICLTSGAWHSLTGRQLQKGFWAGKEVYQTERFLKSECAANDLQIVGHLSDTNVETPSFVIMKNRTAEL